MQIVFTPLSGSHIDSPTQNDFVCCLMMPLLCIVLKKVLHCNSECNYYL